MGNWYTNITLKNAETAAVVQRLRTLGRRSIVHPTQNSWTTLYDEECESGMYNLPAEFSSVGMARWDC